MANIGYRSQSDGRQQVTKNPLHEPVSWSQRVIDRVGFDGNPKHYPLQTWLPDGIPSGYCIEIPVGTKDA